MKFLWFYYTWCGALRQGKRQQEKDNYVDFILSSEYFILNYLFLLFTKINFTSFSNVRFSRICPENV